MFRRAIICALLAPFGTLAVAAAPLNAKLKNTTFQPGAAIKAPRLSPAQSVVWKRSPLWTGAQVRKITAGVQPRGQIELSGFVFTKASEATVRPSPIKVAEGTR